MLDSYEVALIKKFFTDVKNKVLKNRPQCFLTPEEEEILRDLFITCYETGRKNGKNGLIEKIKIKLEML